jgi:hypothetical protein
MKNEKVIIRPVPEHMVPVGETLAVAHCEEHGLLEGTPQYGEEHANYLHNFFHEGVGLSMTASGMIGQNPSTPKVKEEFFRELDVIFGEHGLIKSLKVDESQRTKYDRIMRGNVTSMAHFVLAIAYGLNLKRNDKKSAFEYTKTDSDDQKRDVVQNRYLRIFYIIKVAKALEGMLMEGINTPESMSDLTDEVFGENNPFNIGSSAEAVTFLSDPDNLKQFIKHFYKKELKKSNPSKVSRNPIEMKPVEVSNNLYYIDPEYGFKFKKSVINKLALERSDDLVKLKPLKERYLPEEYWSKVVSFAEMRENVVIGTCMVNNKKENIVIRGINQIIRASDLCLPDIEVIVLDVETTQKLIC